MIHVHIKLLLLSLRQKHYNGCWKTQKYNKTFCIIMLPKKIRGSIWSSPCPIRVRPITSLFRVGFWNYFTEMTTMLRRRVARKFESLPWMSRSQHDLAAKSCPAHNFLIWSRILKIFHRNDHHIETTCCAQIWDATLKVKVTAWPCSKIVSGQ